MRGRGLVALMRRTRWGLAVVANAFVATTFLPALIQTHGPAAGGIGMVAIGLVSLVIVLLLVLVALQRTPSWGRAAMPALCIALPAIWLLGSVDGGITGREGASVAVMALLGWISWRSFGEPA